MATTPMPEWIKQRSADKREDAILRIKGKDGAQFWSQLFRSLEENVKFLPKLGVYGSVSNLTTIADKEQRYRLNAGRRGQLPSITYTDLFYRPEQTSISYRTLEGDQSTFQLCLLPEVGVGVIPEGEFERLDVRALAERLMAEAVDRLAEITL